MDSLIVDDKYEREFIGGWLVELKEVFRKALCSGGLITIAVLSGDVLRDGGAPPR